MNPYRNKYLFQLKAPNKESNLPSFMEFIVEGSNIENKINNILNGKGDTEYFSYGMEFIDIYRTRKNEIGITHSPHEGLNIQYILTKDAINYLKTIFNCKKEGYSMTLCKKSEHNKQMKKEDVENIRLELSKNELEVLEYWLYSCEFDRGLYEKDINLIKKIRKQSKTEFGILNSYE